MKLSTVLVFLTVVAMGAGGPIEIPSPDDDDFRNQLRSAIRDTKSAVDSAAAYFAANAASGQFLKDLANPQFKRDLRKTKDGKKKDTGLDWFKGLGNKIKDFGNKITTTAAGSASSRWTGYSGIVALIGTWVAILVVM